MALNTETFKRHFVASAVFLCSFGLYLVCFQPTGSWGDGADFVLTSYYLGVPHPTGYPTYTLLGKLASLVPAGSEGMRIGLLSSFCGALAAALLFLAAMRVMKIRATAFYAAAVLAATGFFWSQSIVVEAYSLNLAFCWALVILAFGARDVRHALAFFIVGALGMGNHGTLVVPAVLLGLFCLWHAGRASGAAPGFAAVAFLTLLGLTTYAALPLFASRSAVFNWNYPQFARNFSDLLSGYDFWVVGEYIPSEMKKNFFGLVSSVGAQAGAPAALLFIIGLLSRVKKIPARFALFAAFVIAGLFPVLYPTREKESFFLVSYAIFLFFAAMGIDTIVERISNPKALSAVAVAITLIAACHASVLLVRNSPMFAVSEDDSAAIYSDALFLSARRDALVLVDHLADDTIFPPMYGQFIDGRRQDAFLFYRLYLAFPWYLDAMRDRAAELGAQAAVPRIDVQEEKLKNYEIGIEEKQRVEEGKTMNTIAIDIQTARLLDANRDIVPVYINSPDRFKRSSLSAAYGFAPAGALFTLGDEQPGGVPARLASAALASDNRVFREAARDMYTQRGAYYSWEAARHKPDSAAFHDAARRVVANVDAALQYRDDCGMRKILAGAYARLGDTGKAKEQLRLETACREKKYDIR